MHFKEIFRLCIRYGFHNPEQAHRDSIFIRFIHVRIRIHAGFHQRYDILIALSLQEGMNCFRHFTVHRHLDGRTRRFLVPGYISVFQGIRFIFLRNRPFFSIRMCILCRHFLPVYAVH